MNFLHRIPYVFRNKYLLATAGFVIWMLFFDRNDLFTQLEWRKELREMKASKQFFMARIAEDKKFSNDLQFNASALEKYAREQYLMKKDNEDLFLVEPLNKK